MSKVIYQYAIKNNEKAPTVKQGSLTGLSGTFATNPIYNFDQSFINGLNSVTAIEKGQSIPYISLKILGASGEILQDLNLSFFHKPFSAEQINKDLRYSERPIMSLKGLELKTDNASGYLYYTNVVLNLKIHRPDMLGSTFMVALLFPGMPFLLEYGWNSPNSFLDTKDALLMSVKTYNLTFDESGQVDLTIEGTAFNERFNNTLVGDTSVIPSKSTTTNKQELDGIDSFKNKLNVYTSYLSEMAQRSDSAINDYSIFKEFTENYTTNEDKSRGDISSKFSAKLKLLDEVSSQTNFGSSAKNIKTVTLHDIVYTLCNDTFESLGSAFHGVKNLKVVYGSFNSKAGRYANKSIAEFPIDLKVFREKIKSGRDSGRYVPTIEFLLNTLQSAFLENKDYLQSDLTPKVSGNADQKPDTFNKPEVVSHFISRRDSNGDLVMELYIVDIRSGLPITTFQLNSIKKTSSENAKKLVIGETDFPVVELGHANSFIKNISLTQVSDQYMKAALIARMTSDRMIGQRSKIAQKNRNTAAPVTPLQFPLQGSASVLGHPGWKPFRAFYLSSGFFLSDGVYKIQSVKHVLSPEGFNTEIEFLWH